MLTLGRCEGESITLVTSDGPIEVQVSTIEGRQVKVSIQAPVSVKILRSELFERDQGPLSPSE